MRQYQLARVLLRAGSALHGRARGHDLQAQRGARGSLAAPPPCGRRARPRGRGVGQRHFHHLSLSPQPQPQPPFAPPLLLPYPRLAAPPSRLRLRVPFSLSYLPSLSPPLPAPAALLLLLDLSFLAISSRGTWHSSAATRRLRSHTMPRPPPPLLHSAVPLSSNCIQVVSPSPWRKHRTHLPVRSSHSRMLPSVHAEATRLLSGLTVM